MWLVVSRGRENGAYLGAVSWVVYNSCLGFLGGGRRHFTMQGRGWDGVGRMGEGEEEGSGKGHQEKMPRNTDKQDGRMCAHHHKALELQYTEVVEHFWHD